MHFTIQLVAEAGGEPLETQEIARIDRGDGVLSINDLGLTLVEAKTMLAALQTAVTDTQARDFARHRRPCPCCQRPRRSAWCMEVGIVGMRPLVGLPHESRA